ncbi:calcium-binding protein [Rhizobium sp. G21]|uniref:calcium-binding protein n=1 Tax=Rhizobium sp. G21 TaxID=2758439 RepID=UPI0015FF4A33|nr:calcium-binding protein [Rhizobium sp. G21]MBB1248226.1 calcium-binding protein [Rhizobium sp. G21]
MAYIYYGDNGRDDVSQSANRPYDEIYTRGGNDTIHLKANNTYVEAGAGNDYVHSTIEWGNDVYLGDGNDTYVGNGFSGDSDLYDRVWGGNGADTFKISTWASDYYGDAGNDTFYSVGFYNLISGGSGTDTVDYSRQNSDPDLAGAGIKVDLSQEYATSGDGTEEVLYSIENAKGTNYKDTLIGDSGANGLWGQNGDDILKGLDGNDKLYGGSGDDDLYGGRGLDRLTGNSGADFFIFQSTSDSPNNSNRDVIVDFSRSQGDQIDLMDIDAVKSSSRDNAFDFIGSAAFSDTAGELRYSGGIIRGDVNGDGRADFSIEVDNMASLRAGDFIL